jgi:hypothetical protein
VDEELWTAAQARLADNRAIRRKSRIETGALLGGLIYDDRGNIMSPTYTLRRGNRYRYYISSALLHDRKANVGSRARVNADQIERLVVEVLSRELSKSELSADDVSGGWSAETRTLVRDNIERIVVQGRDVQIVGKQSAADEHLRQVVVVPLPAQRPPARKEIIIPGGRESPPRRLNHDLVVTRARLWMQGLRSGKYSDTTAIARSFRLSKEYVRRILRCHYLAPDIVAAIVEGTQPRSLTVKRLLRGVPCRWSDQRAMFGSVR